MNISVNVSHEKLSEILEGFYQIKRPVFIHGTIGIGKSSVVKQTAQRLADNMGLGWIEGEPDGEDKFGFIDVRVTQLEPSDLRGLPTFEQVGDFKTTKWITPNWLPKNPKSKGILFFDELNLATPSIQASCYQLINDRRIGDYVLPIGWLIVSAGNTTNDRSNVYELNSALLNRFAHLELLPPNKDEWVKWALENEIDTNIISFIEFRPSLLFTFDKNAKSKAFATPRSWDFCSQLIKNAKTDENKFIFASSCVGEGVATELMAFIKLSKKIDINEILAKPEKVKEIKDISLKFSLLGALAEKYRTDKKNLDKVVAVCPHLEAEFGILLLRYLKGTRKEFIADLRKNKLWIDSLALEYGGYLRDD